MKHTAQIHLYILNWTPTMLVDSVTSLLNFAVCHHCRSNLHEYGIVFFFNRRLSRFIFRHNSPFVIISVSATVWTAKQVAWDCTTPVQAHWTSNVPLHRQPLIRSVVLQATLSWNILRALKKCNEKHWWSVWRPSFQGCMFKLLSGPMFVIVLLYNMKYLALCWFLSTSNEWGVCMRLIFESNTS